MKLYLIIQIYAWTFRAHGWIKSNKKNLKIFNLNLAKQYINR